MKTIMLGEVATIERNSINPENIRDGSHYVGLENITGDGNIVSVVPVKNGELASSKFQFSSEHLLFGKLRPYLRKIAMPSFEGVCSTDILPIKPSKRLDRAYLFHYLRQQSMVDLATSRSMGANLPRLSPTQLLLFEIPLPPLEQQKRIAAILDKADELRAKRRRAIAKLDDLLKSVFLELFGDPVTNPKGWLVGSIELLAKQRSDVRCGPFGTQLKVDEIVDQGVPLLGIENVQDDKFLPFTKKHLTPEKAYALKSFSVENGDVLVTRMGTIGRACTVSGLKTEARISYHLFRVRPDKEKCLPEFLAATISRSGTFQSQLKSLAHGAIMSGLSTSNLKEVKFFLPPISQQKKYVDFVTNVETQMRLQTQALLRLDILFTSLQARAFSGDLTPDTLQEVEMVGGGAVQDGLF